MSGLPDEELMALFQKGDADAFSSLVRKYKDDLTNFVLRFMGERDEADDIVQEAFVRVFRKKQSFHPGAKFSTWLYTIAANLAKTRLRRLALTRFVRLGGDGDEGPVFDLPDERAKTDLAAEESLRDELIQKALNTLPVGLREVIVLRDIQELSYEEISAITGSAMGTVKSRINRARSHLRDLLKDLWDE